MNEKWITTDVDNNDLIPLDSNERALLPWTKKRMVSAYDYEFKNIGFAIPEGYIVVKTNSKENEKFIKDANKKLGINPDSYKIENNSHFIYKLRKTPKIFLSKMGSVLNTTNFIEGIRLLGNGKGYTTIKKDDQWGIRKVEFIESLDKAPLLPHFLMVPSQNMVNLSEYAEGQRDEVVYKKWVTYFRKNRITETFFLKFMVEVSIIKNDPETPAETKLWAKKKWEASEKKGEITSTERTHNDPSTSERTLMSDFLNFDRTGKMILSVYDSKGICEYISKKKHMYYVRKENQIWVKNESGFYEVEDNPQIVVRDILMDEQTNAPTKIVSEITSSLSSGLIRKETFNDKYSVLFLNGNVDIRTGETFELDDKFIPTNQIPWNLITKSKYKSKEYTEARQFVRTLFRNFTSNDKEVERELYELVGATMIKVSFDKAWFLYGTAKNGKSLFIRLLQNILGIHNYVSIDLKDIVNNKFSSSRLYGKLANLLMDMSDAYISDTSLFKRLSSGERLSAEKKGEQAFEFDNNATLVYGTNQLPMFKEEGSGFGAERRIKIIPFLNYFNDPKQAEHVKDMIEQPKVMECIIRLGIDAIIECWKNHFELFESKRSRRYLQNYIKELNHIFVFLKERKIKNGDRLKDIYVDYVKIIGEYNFFPFNYSNFKSKLKKAYLTSSNMEMSFIETKDEHDNTFETVGISSVNDDE